MNILKICTKTLSHFRTILTNSNKNSIFIGVKGGGCNGFKYYIVPTNELPTKLDETIQIDDVHIIVCGHSLIHLIGTDIKWKDDFMGSGLEFKNPNASGTCGCGETFSI
jgi:iron-sulfur cluster assembly accessory protein